MKVGYTEKNHNSDKQFLLHNGNEVNYKRVIDQAGLRRFARNKLRINFSPSKSEYLRGNTLYAPVDLIHFWNAISTTRKPWIVSTSSGLPFGVPRDDPKFRWAAELMAGDNCRRILCTSQFARSKIETKCSNFNTLWPHIKSKLIDLPPPQSVIMRPELKAYIGVGLRIAFVGKDLTRKGGCELINAFARFSQSSPDASLYIVGRISDISLHCSKAYVDRTLSSISNTPSIRIMGLTGSHQVLDLFKSCHISALPSHSETYGYVVLESQACACPVITTDVGAFREINSPRLGWILDSGDQPKNPKLHDVEMRHHLSQVLEERLLETLLHIDQDREELRFKALNAYKNILEKHNPDNHKKRLLRIYRQALE